VDFHVLGAGGVEFGEIRCLVSAGQFVTISALKVADSKGVGWSD
jgi:hypothetical protein